MIKGRGSGKGIDIESSIEKYRFDTELWRNRGW